MFVSYFSSQQKILLLTSLTSGHGVWMQAAGGVGLETGLQHHIWIVARVFTVSPPSPSLRSARADGLLPQ
jgi:hypothetical protein